MAGQLAGAPKSPLEATKVTPAWPAGVVKALWRLDDVSEENSRAPQLMDTATTPGWLRASLTAPSKSLRLLERASTSRILAPGATAWAHSASRAVSPAQPGSLRGVPCGVATVRKLLAAPYWARSDWLPLML